jgi:hypothetical protein
MDTNILLHPDILSLLSLKDAIKLRLASKELSDACTKFYWNDKKTRVKDLEKWQICFPNSIALHFSPFPYLHEKCDIDFLNNSFKSINTLKLETLKTLVFPRITLYKHIPIYPLNKVNGITELYIEMNKNVLKSLLMFCGNFCNQVQKLTCDLKSDLLDTDFLECSFLTDGSLNVINNFWNYFPALVSFDCSCTKLSHSILDSFSQKKHNLKFLYVNQDFNLKSNEAKFAIKNGVQILIKHKKLKLKHCDHQNFNINDCTCTKLIEEQKKDEKEIENIEIEEYEV